MSLRWPSSRVAVIAVVGAMLLPVLGAVSVIAQPAGRLVLEDFRATGVDGFPQGWKAQRSETKARQAYTLRSEQDLRFLAATRADQRVYKRMANAVNPYGDGKAGGRIVQAIRWYFGISKIRPPVFRGPR